MFFKNGTGKKLLKITMNGRQKRALGAFTSRKRDRMYGGQTSIKIVLKVKKYSLNKGRRKE